MIESHPEGQQSSINYHLSTIIYHLSFIIYHEERTLAKNHPLRHHDTYGDSNHLRNHLVHRTDAVRHNEKREQPMLLSLFVGVAGFEPTTPCSQSRCANRTALHPETIV